MKKIYKVFLVVVIAAMITATASAAATTGADSLSIGGATEGVNGQQVDILVNATNVSGVGAFQIDILYNASVISANGVTIGTAIPGLIAGPPDNVNGSINIAGISTTGLEGSGTFATINFTVVGVDPDSTDISVVVKELLDIDSLPVARSPVITNGTFTVTGQVVDPCEGGPDCIPPVTTLTGVTEGTTYNDNVTITLSASDTGGSTGASGINETIYMVNGGPTQTYTVPFVVSIEGPDNVTYWSTDNQGNVEPQNIVNFIIDKSVIVEPCNPETGAGDCIPPTTTISGVTEGTTYNADVTVTLSAEDNVGGSGVATTEYMVNGGATTTYTVPFVVSTEGPDTVQARSTDNAGNVEEWQIVNFIINKSAEPPVTGDNGTVKGKVYKDRDHDKKLDKGESGIKNVHVRIRGLDANNKDIKLKTHTNSKGMYEFSDLPDGKYSVHVEHKHGWRHTSKVTVKVTIEDGNTKTVNFGKRHK